MKHKNFLYLPSAVLLLLTSLSITGCTESASDTQGRQDLAVQDESLVKSADKPPAGTPKQNQGLVKSIEMAGGYSYIEVDVSGETFWLATTPTQLQVGDQIAWQNYAMMTNFSSKTLNRVFDRILFVDRVFSETSVASHPRRGIVAESMNAAGYSFIRLDENGSSIWLAAPETRIEVGQSIEWQGGTLMRDFTSRSLNRKFDEITFVSVVQAS
jgi:hypothetical protein